MKIARMDAILRGYGKRLRETALDIAAEDDGMTPESTYQMIGRINAKAERELLGDE
jgi:hypothetical protein